MAKRTKPGTKTKSARRATSVKGRAKPKLKVKVRAKAKVIVKPRAKRDAKPPEAKAARESRSAQPKTAPTAPTVTREQLLAGLAAIQPRLEADPIYRDESNAPFDAAELARYFSAAATTTLEHLFSDTLQGMIQSVRFSAIRVVRELFKQRDEVTMREGFKIARGETFAVIGDLTVEGDLQNEGVLVVTGDLKVTGVYTGPGFDYSLAAVGGTMRARDLSTSGEIVVGERLEVTGVVHFYYNDYSSVLPTLAARALIVEDNFPALGDVKAEFRFDRDPTDDQLRQVFGASVARLGAADDSDTPRVRRLITAHQG